jgi:hypothetical protein
MDAKPTQMMNLVPGDQGHRPELPSQTDAWSYVLQTGQTAVDQSPLSPWTGTTHILKKPSEGHSGLLELRL